MREAPPRSLLADERPGPLGELVGRVLALGFRLTGRARYDDDRHERIDGLSIRVLPTVANPKVLRTGAFLARCLDADCVSRDARVLDLGTGSGICALRAAELGARVVATDVNPAAIRCAALNATDNGLTDRIEFRAGDLFDPLAAERFDLVLFNPPFLSGAPGDARECAWRAGTLPERFANGLSDYLMPGGSALLLLSSFGAACPEFERALCRRGYGLSVFARRRFINETVTVLHVRPGEASS